MDEQIIGPTDVNIGEVDNYTVVPPDGTTYVWTAIGGNIVDGQGTCVVNVQWEVLPGELDVLIDGILTVIKHVQMPTA